MKSKGAIIAVITGVLTSLSVSAHINQDSILNYGNKTKNKVELNLDSLKVIETEAEQPVIEEIFLNRKDERGATKIHLPIYGQHLSEPCEEHTLEVL